MLRGKTLIAVFGILTTTALVLLCLSCGSSSSHTLSTAQAQAVSQELFTALGAAMASGFQVPASTAHTPRLPEIVQSAPTLNGCTITNNGESCNIPITYSGNCPNGGSIGVSGDLVFNLDNNGNGSDNSTLTITPTNCVLSNTTVNGDPNVTVTSQIVIQNYGLGFPLTFTEGGGISFGPNPSGTCTLNVTVTASSATSCTVTGSICGHSVNGSC